MTVLADIRAKLAAKADAAYLKSIQRLVPGVKSIGVRVPQLKALSAELHKQLAAQPDDAIWSLMDALCASAVRDEILLGVFLIARRRKAVAPWSHIETWTKAVDNWETCDQLATCVISGRMQSEPALQKRFEDIASYINPMSPAELLDYIRTEQSLWKPVIEQIATFKAAPK